MLPLILRELRSEARRPWNYWLRLLAGAIVTSLFAFAMVARGLSVAANGGMLFGLVTKVLYYSIWLFVPLLTADCLSREKREGTLGLLFLTPLKASEIVLAKSAVHLFRAMSFLCAALPVIIIPLLMGGVSGRNIIELFAGHLGTILVALSAGLLASAFAREWVRAVLLTAIFALMLYALLRVPYWFITHLLWARAGSPPTGGGPVTVPFLWLWTTWTLFMPVIVFALTVFVAQSRLRAASLDDSLSKRKLWWLKTFCQPVIWKERFRTSMTRTLDANPIGWLQQYSWSARLTKWGWCFIVITVETHLLAANSWAAFRGQQVMLLVLLGLGMTFSSAGSFRRERQTGALELILVSPLRVHEIVWGRLIGIWFQFGPAFLIFAGAVWFGRDFTSFATGAVPDGQILALVLTMFLTLPVIGLYQSLRRGSFLVGWLMTSVIAGGSAMIAWTLIMIVLRPGGLLVAAGGAFIGGELADWLLFATIISQVIAASLLALALIRDLEQRNFTLEQQVA